MTSFSSARCWWFLLCVHLFLVGCGGDTSPPQKEVVVYCALDREFAEPILKDWEKETGIQVRAVYDAESTKTVGLVNRILAEKSRPQCDLFWNNEVLHTLRLEREGLLAEYAPQKAKEFPAEFQSPQHTWHGFAARARVLIINTKLLPDEAARPKGMADLLKPKWKDKVAMAKPLFGTTATHAACLFAAWGDEQAKEYFTALKANARILSGNKQVALAVAGGELPIGLTDTDDALIELEKQMPVAILYPDAEDMGTLFIPNTICLMKGSPHSAAAQRLADHLLQPQIEERLSTGPSGQIPLHPRASASPRIKTPQQTKAMQIDFSAAAAKWQKAAEFLTKEFASP